MDEKIVVLIPAYEPTSRLINLLKELKKHSFKVVIVNDGSGIKYDDIFIEAKNYGTVLTHDFNKGKGRALKTGIKYIHDNMEKDCIVVTMDCDGQHTVNDLLKISKYAICHPDMLILGKRIRSKKTPLRSRFGNSITRFFYKLITHIDVYDTQTGLRAFSNKLSPFMLSIEGERFEYEMNVLLKCPTNKIKIKEIEIETIYIDNNSHSHFDTVKDSILVYKEIFKFLMSSIISFIIDYLSYSVILVITNSLTLSNIIARIISSTVNYNVNKRIVFKNKSDGHKQIFEYFILALIILSINTIVLNILVTYLSVNIFVAKIIVEICLFILSWFIQKKVIFYECDNNEKN